MNSVLPSAEIAIRVGEQPAAMVWRTILPLPACAAATSTTDSRPYSVTKFGFFCVQRGGPPRIGLSPPGTPVPCGAISVVTYRRVPSGERVTPASVLPGMPIWCSSFVADVKLPAASTAIAVTPTLPGSDAPGAWPYSLAANPNFASAAKVTSSVPAGDSLSLNTCLTCFGFGDLQATRSATR